MKNMCPSAFYSNSNKGSTKGSFLAPKNLYLILTVVQEAMNGLASSLL